MKKQPLFEHEDRHGNIPCDQPERPDQPKQPISQSTRRNREDAPEFSRRHGKGIGKGKGQQVDLQALFIEPVSVVKGGKVYKMDPFEAMLRRQLELALKERSMAAMKIILENAIEYDLIRRPAASESGGVLRVPMITEEDIAFVRSWEPTVLSGGNQKE